MAKFKFVNKIKAFLATELGRSILRAVRSGFYLTVSMLIAIAVGRPELIALQPILLGLDKFIRERIESK